MASVGLGKVYFIFVNKFFRDRFRTAINVFGDSIGCAIVQHLSHKELNALDNKESTINTNTVLPLLVSDIEHGTTAPNGTLIHSSNTTYDNPTFKNEFETNQ